MEEIELYQNGLLILGIAKLVELINLPSKLAVTDNRYKLLLNIGASLLVAQFTFVNKFYIKLYMKKQ
jgi:hypothetical protein